MRKYIFKRKDGNGEWEDKSNNVNDMEEAVLEIVTEVKAKMSIGSPVFVIILAAPNTEVINLERAIRNWVEESEDKDRIEIIYDYETTACGYTDVILKTTHSEKMVPLIKPYIEKNEVENMRDPIKNGLEALKENLVFIFPCDFPKKNDESQAYTEKFAQLWADVLGKHSIMYQCINRAQVMRQFANLMNLHLQDLLDKHDDLLAVLPNNATVIDEIIETRVIQLIEEYELRDKFKEIISAVMFYTSRKRHNDYEASNMSDEKIEAPESEENVK